MTQEWQTDAFRSSLVRKLEEAIRESGNTTQKNAVEMEKQVFQRAKSKEEYLSFMARLILHVRQQNTGAMQGNDPNLNHDHKAALQQQGSFPPHNAAAQQQGFPPHKAALQQQGSFPPHNAAAQQQGFPPHKAALQQQGSFPPHKAAPQQQGFPPQNGGFDDFDGKSQQKTSQAKTVKKFQPADSSAKDGGKVPVMTRFVKMDDGSEKKMFRLIFEAGEKLLEQKISEAAKGKPQEPYSTPQHLEMLNVMFSETLSYNPDKLSNRIADYMKKAKDSVKINEESGQGMLNEENYSQQEFEEARIGSLFRDSQKVCVSKVQKPQVFHGAQTRYYKGKGLPAKTTNLEEAESCFNCGNTEELKVTESGKICMECLTEQGDGEASFEKIKKEAKKREEEAKVTLNKALFHPNNAAGSSGASGPSARSRKRKPRFSDDEDDDDKKISQVLLNRLETSGEREQLEIRKLRLEMEILEEQKKKLVKENQS